MYCIDHWIVCGEPADMAVVARAMKVLLLLVLWGLFIFWTVEWCIYPTERGTKWKKDAIARTPSKFLDLNGKNLILKNVYMLMKLATLCTRIMIFECGLQDDLPSTRGLGTR